MVVLKIYHLPEDDVLDKLPHLVAKAFVNGERIFIICDSEEEVDSVDKKLWTFSQEIFLPHATMKDEFLDQNPIIVSTRKIDTIAPEIFITTSHTKNGFVNHLKSISQDDFKHLKSIIWMTNALPNLNLMNEASEILANTKETADLQFSTFYYRLENNVWKHIEPQLI